MANENYIHGTAPKEQERLALLNRLTNPAFLNFLDLKPTDTVLEVGSGLGILAAEVAQKVPDGQMIGLEISTAQLALAPKNIPNLTFVQGDAAAMNFPENHFDVVYGRYILEHVQHPSQVLQAVYRTLKPGGSVYFQENAIQFVYFYPECSTFEMVWAKFLDLQALLGGDGMIGVKLHYLLKHAGFKKLELSAALQIHSPEDGQLVDWTENIIGNVRSGENALMQAGLCTAAQIKTAIHELEALKNRTDASAYFYWNRVKGCK